MTEDAPVHDHNRAKDVIALCRCAAEAWANGADETAECYLAAAHALIAPHERFVDSPVSEDA